MLLRKTNIKATLTWAKVLDEALNEIHNSLPKRFSVSPRPAAWGDLEPSCPQAGRNLGVQCEEIEVDSGPNVMTGRPDLRPAPAEMPGFSWRTRSAGKSVCTVYQN